MIGMLNHSKATREKRNMANQNLEARNERIRVGLSPGLSQTAKTLLAVRWNCIVQRRRFLARCGPAGEAEAGSAGAQPAKYDDMELDRSTETLRGVADLFTKHSVCAAIEPIHSAEVSFVHTI